MHSIDDQLVTAPTSDPVTVAEAKQHLRIDHNSEDAWLARAITAATRTIEDLAGVALMSQTRKVTLPAFPPGPVRIHRGPVASISTFLYTDTAGITQTLTDYQARLGARPAELFPAAGKSWPSAGSGYVEAVRVTYVAGKASASDVDPRAKQAILLLLGDWYANREDYERRTVGADVTRAVNAIAQQLHSGWIA